VDRAAEHLYCHALLHTDRLPHAHPDLDAHAEQHTASHLYCVSDTHAAPHLDGLAHAYASHPTPDMDFFLNAYTDHAQSHLDAFTNAHAASYAYSHAYLNSNSPGYCNTIKA
jgi:hypothetical protein